MSNIVIKDNNKKSLWQYVLRLLGFTEEVDVIIEPIDPRIEYIRNSVKRIHTLSDILKCDEFLLGENVTMEQCQVFNDILKVTKEVHLRIEKDVNIVPQKLEQFHMYYTDNLFNLLKSLKYQREDIREVPINPEPYIRKAVSYRDAILKNAIRDYEKGVVERYGDVIANRMIREDRETFITELDRRIFFIKHSKDDSSPIFYSMGHLYKVDLENEGKTTKLLVNEGFQKRIQEAKDGRTDNFSDIRLTKNKTFKIDYFNLSQEQYSLIIEYKEKIEDYFINLDGKKEKIEMEMNNLKSILNTDMLDLS